jgi:hypothetical protein
MIDDILAGLFGEAVFGRLQPSRRAQLLARVFFGLVGGALGVAGVVHFSRVAASAHMTMSMMAVFVGLTCFCLFNIALGRAWRWPGLLFAVSFVLLFVVRILLGP